MRTDFQLRTPGVTVKAQSPWNPGASHRFNNWVTPQMDHFGVPCHRSGPKSRSWGKTSELPGVDVLLVSMGKHQNISKPCGRKTPRGPLHKQGLEFIQSCPVVYVPESEARLYKTNFISGMIINPLIGIYSDLCIYIYTHHVDSHYEMDDYEPYIIGYMPRIYPLQIPTIYPRIIGWPLQIIYICMYIYICWPYHIKHRLTKAATCHPPALY